MREKNVEILNDTLITCARGNYKYGTNVVALKLPEAAMTESIVYLPWQLDEMRKEKHFDHTSINGCTFSCVNTDSFELARQIAERDSENKVLVLNLANPVHIGGGARNGAKAQEEDLCRQSSLLLSLESEEAEQYYVYNRSLNTKAGSDAIIITPNVEIIKDASGNYLDHTTIVSVMTCAAPIINPVTGLDFEKYRSMMYHRIEGMLVCAAFHGYRHLVLGAFGCGAFHNDAAIVAEIFNKAIQEFSFDGMNVDELFKSIDFAVLSNSKNIYNYHQFSKYFGDFQPYNYYEKNTDEKDIGLIGFLHEYETYGCLSNWYKADFEYAGKRFASVEQFMMYHKLLTFYQFDLADKVMKTDDPAEAKKIGRTHFSNFDDTLWTRISPIIVKRGVRAKFEQHPELLEELLSTGNAVLAECSPYDKVWGIGLAPDDERIYDTTQWNGKNKLGRILMTLREEFRNWAADPDKERPAYIDAMNLPSIPEWETNTGMLKMIPQYHGAIDAYSATLKGPEITAFYQMTFSSLEFAMRTNMGGGMPVIGFYEMKQDIYDIARRLNHE